MCSRIISIYGCIKLYSNHQSQLGKYFLNQARAWFLEIAFVCNVSMCVSAPEAINYIHVIFNLYNQLNKFVAFRNVAKKYMGVAFVMKHVVTETKAIRLC